MKLLGVVGARPNFMKMAPVIRALQERGADAVLVDTGQHFDPEMSQLLVGELGLPEPRVNLGVGALSPWSQAGRIVEGLGDVITSEQPDWVLVPGAVNSTLAAAIAATRTEARLAHLESGLRSFDRRMPEERNSTAVDHLADRLYVTERTAQENLRREVIPDARVRFVGNTMVDTLLASRELAAQRDPVARLGLPDDEDFILLTMHRPETVDTAEGLGALLDVGWRAASRAPVVFPMHPRTRRRIGEFAFDEIWERPPSGSQPEGWDGSAGERVAEDLLRG